MRIRGRCEAADRRAVVISGSGAKTEEKKGVWSSGGKKRPRSVKGGRSGRHQIHQVLHPGLQQRQEQGRLGKRLENEKTGLGQQTSGRGQGAWNQVELKDWRKESQSSALVLRAARHRQEFLAGCGVRGQFFPHPNLALLALPTLTWPHSLKDWGLGALALDLAPAFGSQHPPSRTAALPGRALPSAIIPHSMEPETCLLSFCQGWSQPSRYNCHYLTVSRSLREQAQAMIRAVPLAPRLLASVSHLIFANALPLNSCL